MKDLKELLNESIMNEANAHDEELELKKDYEWCQAFEISDLEAEGIVYSEDVDAIMKMKKGSAIVLPKGSTLVSKGANRFYHFYALMPGNIYISILREEFNDFLKHCK